MQSAQDFRYAAHKLILALDASTVEMMCLIASSSMNTEKWRSTVGAQQEAFVELHLYLTQPGADALIQEISRSKQ
jgi:hypothetical protein